LADDDGARGHAPQAFREARVLELPLEDLALGLPQERIRGIPAHEDFVDEPACRLYLAVRLRLPRISLEHEARDARDLAELALRELGRVEALQHVGEQALAGKQARFQERQ